MENIIQEPLFIAEVSSNHFQNLDRCKSFIDVAAKIGCWGVKFQLFKINELFSPEILKNSKAHRDRINWELPVEFIPFLKEHCRKQNIHFGCTPFYLNAITELFEYVDFYKIASYELLWDDLLAGCAKTKKPIILSTGMATMDEIIRAVGIIKDSGCRDLSVLHCVSGYPTPVTECNLAVIHALRERLKLDTNHLNMKFGWSDHSVNPGVIGRAIHHWDSKIIEFHLDIDGKGEEFTSGHCWLPADIESVIRQVKAGLSADGNGTKAPTSAELPDRDWRADPSDGLRPFKHIRKQFDG